MNAKIKRMRLFQRAQMGRFHFLRNSASSMTHKHISIGSRILMVCTILTVCSVPRQAIAAESTSFKLYENHPNTAAGNPAASTNFSFDTNRMTWRLLPLASSSFRLVSGFTPSGGGGSSSGGGGSSSGGGGGGGGDDSGGGHRGREPVPPQEEPPAETPVVPEELPELYPSLLPVRPAAPVKPAPQEAPGAPLAQFSRVGREAGVLRVPLIDVPQQAAPVRSACPVMELQQMSVLVLLLLLALYCVGSAFFLVRKVLAIHTYQQTDRSSSSAASHGGKRKSAFATRDLHLQCERVKPSRNTKRS